MATAEHCLYCFEALAAHFDDRKHMSLAEVQKSWAEYVHSTETESDDYTDTPSAATGSSKNKLSKRLPALRRVTESSSSPSSSSSSSSTSSSTSSSASNSTLSLGASTPATSEDSASEDADEAPPETPLFVTWNVPSKRRAGVELRGCIGTFEPLELDEGLASYALISALQDMRFDPVSARELPTLEVAVTLLTDFEDARDAMDWELGTHGLRISFYHRGKRYGATYLPDVAVEQGWTKEETLVSLMRKAGWVGDRGRWRDVDLAVVRYQGKKERMDYAEFKRWRDWVDARSMQ